MFTVRSKVSGFISPYEPMVQTLLVSKTLLGRELRVHVFKKYTELESSLIFVKNWSGVRNMTCYSSSSDNNTLCSHLCLAVDTVSVSLVNLLKTTVSFWWIFLRGYRFRSSECSRGHEVDTSLNFRQQVTSFDIVVILIGIKFMTVPTELVGVITRLSFSR